MFKMLKNLFFSPDIAPLCHHPGSSDLGDVWSDDHIEDAHLGLHGVSVELTHVGPTVL